MKIKLKRAFTYQVDARTTATLQPGIHDVDEHVAKLAQRWGGAELVPEKKAPENKVVEPAENKAGVAKKTKRGRRARPKPDA